MVEARGEFDRLSTRGQLGRLRAAARSALERYDLGDARLDLVTHEFNATYRVTTPDGERFALRLNVNSLNGGDAVEAEAEWVESLGRDARLRVPTPQRTPGGRVTVEVHVDGLDRPCAAVLYRWLDGRILGARAAQVSARAMGEAAAIIHEHGRSAPALFRRRRPHFDRIFMDSPNRLAGVDAPWYPAAVRRTIDTALVRIEQTVTPVLTADDTAIAVHGDLHPWNVMWDRGRLAVFDFDDCGTASPILELAIAAYYLRARGLDRALLSGYRDLADLPDHTDEQFEALVASRAVLLLSDLAGSATATHRAMLADYAALTARRLRHWMDTGRVRLDV